MEKSKIKVAVSILNCNFFNLDGEVKKVESTGIDMLHLDIMDGNFVPNITIGPPVVKAIRENTRLFLDTHLMIKEPDRHLDSFIQSGVDLITVHVEECPHLDRTLSYIKQAGLKAGLALNPSTPLCYVENVLQLVDIVLIMTVNPGFGGQRFIEAMIYKIRKLKDMIEGYKKLDNSNKSIEIQVDGGINLKTAPLVINAGASILVMGTSFFESKSPSKLVDSIKRNFYKAYFI